MIDRFYRNETIGDGELTKLDVLKRKVPFAYNLHKLCGPDFSLTRFFDGRFHFFL